MSNNSHVRRLEHRANVRKAAAGELGEAEAKAVQTAETARKAAIKPVILLNRKQRKNKRAQKRTAK